MKRIFRLLILAALLCGAAAWFFLGRSSLTAMLMLFQQNSTLSIIGWLNKAESSAVSTVFLSMFQSFAMPFKTSPRIVMASVEVLGFGGWLLTVLGRLLAAALWYLIGWLIVGVKLKKDKGMALLYGGLSCFFTPYAAPIALLCGALSLKIAKVMAVLLPVQLLYMGFYAKYGSVYSSIIPDWCGHVVSALGAVMIVAAIVYRKKAS